MQQRSWPPRSNGTDKYLSICFFIALSWRFVGAEQEKMKLLLVKYLCAAVHIPTASPDVTYVVASSCGHDRGSHRATRCALIRGTLGDPERARET